MDAGTNRLLARFKALADPVRARLIALCGVAECSVSELTRVLGLSQPRVSQHLKQLCDAGLLERFRDGHFVYYRVPLGNEQAAQRRRLFALLPGDEPAWEVVVQGGRKATGLDAVEWLDLGDGDERDLGGRAAGGAADASRRRVGARRRRSRRRPCSERCPV